MNLESLVAWLVLASSGVGLVLLFGQRAARREWLWLAKHAGLALLALAAIALPLPQVGWLAAWLYLVLVVFPNAAWRLAGSQAQAEQYAAARRTLGSALWLHPGRHWRDTLRLWFALALAQRGELAAARTALQALAAGAAPDDLARRLPALSFDGRWAELREALAALPAPDDPALRAEWLLYRLLALGMTGDRGALFPLYCQHVELLHRPGMAALRHDAWLFLAAFGGRPDLVLRLHGGPLAGRPLWRQQVWAATAYAAAGATTAAERLLAAIVPPTPLAAHLLAAHSLAVRQPPRVPLQPADWAVLRGIAAALTAEATAKPPFQHEPKPFAVHLCSGLCVGMFALQFVLGGTLDEQVMIRLGALLPAQVLANGEWWRLVTANLLHAGPLHLGANLLGLYVFGPYVANRLGQLRYLLLYFATGIGAMAFVTLVHGLDLARHLPLARPPPWADGAEQLVVGASGSIMGLVGAAAAIFLRQWWRHRLPEQRQRLLLIALVLGFQAAFDLTTPQVSFAAHAAGAVCGLLLAVVLPFRDDTVMLPAPPPSAPEVSHGSRPA